MKRKVINTPESILVVSAFLMILFISKFLVFIPSFEYVFERGTLWFAFPFLTLILALHSFSNRET